MKRLISSVTSSHTVHIIADLFNTINSVNASNIPLLSAVVDHFNTFRFVSEAISHNMQEIL